MSHVYALLQSGEALRRGLVENTTDEECQIWNRFIAKLGWRDEGSHVLPQRIEESGFTGKSFETLLDHIEFDEGRDPVATRAWERSEAGSRNYAPGCVDSKRQSVK